MENKTRPFDYNRGKEKSSIVLKRDSYLLIANTFAV